MSDGLVKVAAAAGCLVVACGIGWVVYSELTEPDSGTVTRREYHPAYSTPGHFSNSCTTTDKGVMHCTQIWVAGTYYPECYEIVYHNEDANRDGDACVSPEDYDHRYEIGTRYP